ncbi:MAG: hypothetical protein ASARMPRED_002898 [Alectoria sarmentosa]|nr:MAG: hypothetical protein ASARMPRED_002898 [Alectoria sarmentosa]
MAPANSEASYKSSIRQLTDDNYPSWLIDVRAVLRKQKLWKYTQECTPESLTVTALGKWNDSCQEAADEMTPTISDPVKAKLQTDAFDNGFLMMIQLANLYAPKGEAEFMRLTREYYSLRYDDFDSMTSYLTQIKTLEERIRNTNVILDNDKQTLLCLGMTLPESYQYFTKIWAMMPGMTADKARNMLLEEERRLAKDRTDTSTSLYGTAFAALRSPDKRFPSRKATLECVKCGKPHKDEHCWKLHPEQAPEWLQEKWIIEKRSRKRKRNPEESDTEEM